MTHRLTDLLSLDAETAAARLGVRALFQREETRALSYVALDSGGWLDRREVLVAIDRFGPPGRETWPLAMAEEELERAPQWHDGAPGFLDTLPPIVVGPMGYTFSPALMAAGMAVVAERDAVSPPDPLGEDLVTRGSGRLFGMERADDWIGKDAFGPQGHMGEVTDLFYGDDLVLRAVIVGQEEIALGRLSRRADQGHLVFD